MGLNDFVSNWSEGPLQFIHAFLLGYLLLPALWMLVVGALMWIYDEFSFKSLRFSLGGLGLISLWLYLLILAFTGHSFRPFLDHLLLGLCLGLVLSVLSLSRVFEPTH